MTCIVLKQSQDRFARTTDLRDHLQAAGYDVSDVEVVSSVLNELPEENAMICKVL
jgi:hypothetical protein